MDLVPSLGDSAMVDVTGGRIRVYERGAGRPIVFVHGMLANAAVWRKVVPLLADDYRCITADWPFGSHSSPMNDDADLTPTGLADSVAEVIERLDLHDVTLVGNDGGGMLTQLVITSHPERIARVVLTPCDAYENFPPKMFAYLCWLAKVPAAFELLGTLIRIPLFRRLLVRSPIGYGGLSHRRIDDDLLDHYSTPVLDRGVRRDLVRFLQSVDSRYTLDAARLFGEVSQPVLVAWASDDRFFPLEHAERLAEDFSDTRLSVVTGSRTWVSEDKPEELASLIGNFISDAGHVQPTATLDRTS